MRRIGTRSESARHAQARKNAKSAIAAVLALGNLVGQTCVVLAGVGRIVEHHQSEGGRTYGVLCDVIARVQKCST